MKITYDRQANAAYVYLVEKIGPGEVRHRYRCDPDEVRGMIILDVDAEGRLLGMEVIDATVLLRKETLDQAEIIDKATAQVLKAFDWYGMDSGDLIAVQAGVEKALGVRFGGEPGHMFAEAKVAEYGVERFSIERNASSDREDVFTDQLPPDGILLRVTGTERSAEIQEALKAVVPGLRLLRHKEALRWV